MKTYVIAIVFAAAILASAWNASCVQRSLARMATLNTVLEGR